jgi:allantoinase
MDEAASFAVRGGRLVLPDRIIEADLLVAEGRIAAIAPWSVPAAGADVDARGLLVMAGMIDPHVHMRDPDSSGRDDFPHCTAAAAVGGVTTVFDMPNTEPAVGSAATLTAKRDSLAGRSHVDFALYGGAGASNAALIGEQAEAGAIAFKSFMNAPSPAQGEAGLSRCLPDDLSFFDAMRAIAASGRIGVLHAENDTICTGLAARMAQAGRNDALAHAHSRPAFAEAEAVGRAIVLARAAGAAISFAHVSTGAALGAIRAAKAAGQRVTAEATPHHLLLDEGELARLGPYGKINPPLRHPDERVALWAGLGDGGIDFIGTDHAPYGVAEKEAGWAEIWRAPSGAHGLETALPMLLGQALAGRITLPQLTCLVSRNVARIFGLYPRKGELMAGADADFILVDPDWRGTVERGRLHSLTRDAARLWDGRPLRARIAASYLRGRAIARNGAVVDGRRSGRFVGPGARS